MDYPIITLSNLSLKFDNKNLFYNINLSILKGDRVCLVGRNGSGKSSLLKIIYGSLVQETGDRFLKPGSNIAFLRQSDDFSKFETLGDFVLNGLTKVDYLKQENRFSQLRVDFDKNPKNASGGELRRASLIRTFILPSDVLLLDEPTNHLDIEAIEFLEQYLLETRKAIVLISHDRLFLEKVGNKLLWLDRGSVQKINKNFCYFEDFRDKSYAREVDSVQKLKNKIKREALWAIEGISARRKRNQKRLKELQALKLQKSQKSAIPGLPKFKFSQSDRSSKLVVEAKNISKNFNTLKVINEFSFSIHRGDRIAIVGPNGVGKTTLINLFLKKDNPDFGTVKLGMALDIAVFDQNKDSLPSEMSLWNFLSGIIELGVSGKNDSIMVQNKSRNIVSYLNDFLFTREQVYGKISDLSGGEKSRLLLALLMAKSSNMLVLDEPTNDLDLETLDLLKELIASYVGTVIFVSHDRDFIDSVASHTLLLERNKSITVHAGSFIDFRSKKQKETKQKKEKSSSREIKGQTKKPKLNKNLTQDLSKDLLLIEAKIEKLNNEIKKLELFLSNEKLYVEDKKKFESASRELVTRQAMILEAEEEWLRFEELKSSS